MTKRNPDLTSPMVVSFVADYQEWQKFRELVGEQNASREIRAYIKDRVNLQKNEEAQRCDPIGLGLSSYTKDSVNNTRQSTLFEVFVVKDRRDEIVQFVHSLKDTQELNRLEQNCKCMLKVSETRRKRIVMK